MAEHQYVGLLGIWISQTYTFFSNPLEVQVRFFFPSHLLVFFFFLEES